MRDYTYIAGDYDNDKSAIETLYWMRDKGYLKFKDAHEIQQSNDSSLACSIKKSLKTRLSYSYKFVLVVGKKTNTVSKGGCQLCPSYNSHTYSCGKGNTVDYRSFIKYECENAAKDNLTIIVLYNSGSVNKDLCPEAVRKLGTHRQMWKKGNDGKNYWDYEGIAKAIGG